MNTPTVTKQEREMQFVPFGAADKITLNIRIVREILAVPSKSGKLPTDTDCIKFMMLCQAQRLNPFAGDAFLLGYDTQGGAKFSLVTAHVAYLKRAETNDDYDGMLSGIIVEEDGKITEIEGDFHLPSQKVLGGWAKVFHKKRQHPIYRKLRLSRFNKGFAQWNDDPAGMICKCAEADALRSSFPTMLGGLYNPEEVTQVISASELEPSIEEAPKVTLRRAKTEAKELKSTVESPPENAPAPNPATVQSGAEGVVSAKERIDKAGVFFDDFCDFMINQGIDRNIKLYPSFADLPASTWETLEKMPSVVAKLIKVYGKPTN